MRDAGILGPEFNFHAAWPVADQEVTPEACRRAAVEPTRGLCIIASCRNEGTYFLEWLAYHMDIGVEAFFIYSNNDDDGSDALLRCLDKAGVISYRESDGRGCCAPQYKAYGHALKEVPQVLDYEWALIIDLDEYVVLDRSRFVNMPQFLATMNADVVSLNWHMFGVFGQERADLNRPLAERFTMRFPEINPHTKCAFRPRFCDHSHAHYPFGSGAQALRRVDATGNDFLSWPGELALSQAPVEGGAWINHYWTKSLDEMRLKFGLNTGDQPLEHRRTSDEVQLKLDAHLALEASITPVADCRIQPTLASTKSRMEKLLALPGVREAYEAVVHERINVLLRTRNQ